MCSDFKLSAVESLNINTNLIVVIHVKIIKIKKNVVLGHFSSKFDSMIKKKKELVNKKLNWVGSYKQFIIKRGNQFDKMVVSPQIVQPLK